MMVLWWSGVYGGFEVDFLGSSFGIFRLQVVVAMVFEWSFGAYLSDVFGGFLVVPSGF